MEKLFAELACKSVWQVIDKNNAEYLRNQEKVLK